MQRDDDRHRIRLSIPREDQVSRQWLKAQRNASLSMRILIRDYVGDYGYTDPLSRELKDDEVGVKQSSKPVVETTESTKTPKRAKKPVEHTPREEKNVPNDEVETPQRVENFSSTPTSGTDDVSAFLSASRNN